MKCDPTRSIAAARRVIRMTRRAALVFIAAALLVSPHAEEAVAADPAPRATPIKVLATTAMIGDIVREVAGERAAVTTLMGPGVDPHLYRPTRGDVRAMLDADMVFYNGLNLEGKMSDTFVQVARSGKSVYAVTELIGEDYVLGVPDGAAEPVPGDGDPAAASHLDPHVWMDPNGWMKATQVVIDALSTHDSLGASTYRERGEAYLSQLQQLDAYAKQAFATIPKDSRVLVTAHDAFNYMARAYGLDVQAIQGISTDSEAGLKRIEDLVDLLVTRRIAAVFTETSVSDKNIQALLDGARARGHAAKIGGTLFSDAMGEPGAYEGTYVGMIDHNVTTIVRALGGEAPPTGFNGKLKRS
jgi:manganese/zinc/iron transport system substrate-binding protein